jgi:hypothetical protein
LNEVYGNDFLDIIDTRDFLIGTKKGGLLCQFNGGFSRIPYFFPFVNLETRTSIKFDVCRQITKEIISLNISFFEKHPYLTVDDCCQTNKEFMAIRNL